MNKLLSNFMNLSRIAPASHFRTVAAAAPSPPDVPSEMKLLSTPSTPRAPSYRLLKAYAPSNIFEWMKCVGAYWGQSKHPYLTYDQTTGITEIPNQTSISLAADWGSGSEEAVKVAQNISAFRPAYTIHLGDTYYVGNEAEVNENFLGVKTSEYDPVAFPRGTRGTFALMGNHDMFTNGNAFFDIVLPALGQKASFFCLRNDRWTIVGLDTGYNSTGIQFWPFLKPSCRLHDEQMKWLASLDLQHDPRRLILLSHHQPWSAFEAGYPRPWQQVSELLGGVNKKEVLWFWGHEHRLAMYRPYQRVTGRCIGHGGMPVELKNPKNTDTCECTFTDQRLYTNSEGLKVGYNGFANLIFDGPMLRVDYRDVDNLVVYREGF